MNFDVSHKTHYRYTFPVVQSQHLIHMSPRSCPWQAVRHHSLLVQPAPALRQDLTDAFGNPVVMLDIEAPHDELVLHARSSIATTPRPAIDPATDRPWDAPAVPSPQAAGGVDLEVAQYQCASRLTTPTLDIAGYAVQSFLPGRPLLEAAADLNRRMFQDFTFDATATDISTPVTETFQQRRGVCQDFAHLTLACLRALRVPSRYVSGYILTQPPPGMPRLQGADASHAWVSVWSAGAGWVDFDPTNGIAVSDEHITIAYGRDYDDISPISGVLLGGGEHTVSVAVDIVPVP